MPGHGFLRSTRTENFMRYRNLGGTGLLASEICLGTMPFGGKGFWTAIGTLDQSLADGIIARALEAGINFQSANRFKV
jgi:aryl-alcohol dehydrogenase-like predicted oxidoreductase